MIGSSFGVMQGRLSPMVNGAYQAFPIDSWLNEFDLARSRRFQHIEWVVDSESLDNNPLITDTAEVRRVIDRTGVKVVSVCADFLMDTPLDTGTEAMWPQVGRLVDSMHSLGATYLVIPAVDQSSVQDLASRSRLSGVVNRLTDLYGDSEIRLALETDLPPQEFAELLDNSDRGFVGVNYDIGNSASLGFSPEDEFDAYGDRIALVHVKDRVRGGFSVPLGTGDADIMSVWELLRATSFDGPVTLQCYRDVDGIRVLDEQVTYLLDLIGEA